MRIVVIGAGQVGTAVVESLHVAHDVTVVDWDPVRLTAMASRYDILVVKGNGASRTTLLEAGVATAELVIASTDRAEVNIVASMLARQLGGARVIARIQTPEYLEAWRAGQFDVDFMVSAEIETAQAVARAIGLPSAVQTDVFANGSVELSEFAVHAGRCDALIGVTLADADVPDDCVVASIIRDDRVIIPGGSDRIEAGDRLVFIASAAASREWARRLSGSSARPIQEIVIAGGGPTGRSIAALLASLGRRVRLIEIDEARARLCAEELTDVRVFHADASDPEFMMREQIGHADALVCCTDDDARDLLIGLLGKKLGVDMVIAVVAHPEYVRLFEAVGIDLALNQRQIVAEELVRFTHDPRTLAFAIVDGDRGEVLELDVRETSSMLGRPFSERPLPKAIVGAIIRGGDVIYPRGKDSLQAGDRAIVFTDSVGAREIERLL